MKTLFIFNHKDGNFRDEVIECFAPLYTDNIAPMAVEEALTSWVIDVDELRGYYRLARSNFIGEVLQSVQGNNKHREYPAVLEMMRAKMELGGTIMLRDSELTARQRNRFFNEAAHYGYQVYVITGGLGSLPLGDQETDEFPTYAHSLRFDEIEDVLTVNPVNGKDFGRLVAIGDIHGYIDQLEEVFAKFGHPKDTQGTLFIFCGDYVDGGPETGKVLEVLEEIIDLPNVRVIIGNHDFNLFGVASSMVSKEIVKETWKTWSKLMDQGWDAKRYRKLYRKMIPGVQVDDVPGVKEPCVFFSHAGVSYPTARAVSLFCDAEFFYGASTTQDVMNGKSSWSGLDWQQLRNELSTPCVQVFGHRNAFVGDDFEQIVISPDEETTLVNVESGIKKGGWLSCAVFNENDIEVVRFAR